MTEVIHCIVCGEELWIDDYRNYSKCDKHKD